MSRRASLIKMVHIGARNLFDDEEARRDWQQARTGHASCSDMTDAQLDNLVAELRRKQALKPRKPPAADPQARKIYALWTAMHRDGLIESASSQALGRFCHRITGRYRPEWLTPEQANQVIESLKQWRKRVENERDG